MKKQLGQKTDIKEHCLDYLLYQEHWDENEIECVYKVYCLNI